MRNKKFYISVGLLFIIAITVAIACYSYKIPDYSKELETSSSKEYEDDVICDEIYYSYRKSTEELIYLGDGNFARLGGGVVSGRYGYYSSVDFEKELLDYVRQREFNIGDILSVKGEYLWVTGGIDGREELYFSEIYGAELVTDSYYNKDAPALKDSNEDIYYYVSDEYNFDADFNFEKYNYYNSLRESLDDSEWGRYLNYNSFRMSWDNFEAIYNWQGFGVKRWHYIYSPVRNAYISIIMTEEYLRLYRVLEKSIMSEESYDELTNVEFSGFKHFCLIKEGVTTEMIQEMIENGNYYNADMYYIGCWEE